VLKAQDQFHLGIVVEDFETTLAGRGSWKAPSWSVEPRALPRIRIVNPASNRSFARRIAR
jgi:hypothetical protein